MSKHQLASGAGVAAVLLAGFAGAVAAVAEPCDTVGAPEEFLPPPYTVDQLKATMAVGLKVISEMKVTMAGESIRELTVVERDEESVVFLDVGLESDEMAEQAIANDRRTMTWEGLRDTACFPKVIASRERVAVETPLGELEGWRYRITEGDNVATLVFADDLPGFPVLVERWQGRLLAMRVKQVSRSDLPASAAEAS